MDITSISQLLNMAHGTTDVKAKKQQVAGKNFDYVLTQKVGDSSAETHEANSNLSDVSLNDGTVKSKAGNTLSNDEVFNILNMLQMILSNSLTNSPDVTENSNQASENLQGQVQPKSSTNIKLDLLAQILNKMQSIDQDLSKKSDSDNSNINVMDEILNLLQSKLTSTGNAVKVNDSSDVSSSADNLISNFTQQENAVKNLLVTNSPNKILLNEFKIDEVNSSNQKLTSSGKTNSETKSQVDNTSVVKQLIDLLNKVKDSSSNVDTSSNMKQDSFTNLQNTILDKPLVVQDILNSISKIINQKAETKTETKTENDITDNNPDVTAPSKEINTVKTGVVIDLQKIISDIKQGTKGFVDNQNVDSKSSQNSSDKDDKFLISIVKDAPNDKTASEQGNLNLNVVLNKDAIATASPDKIVISKQNIASDIVKTVKYMESADLKDLTVKIMPKELGEVVIKLTMERGEMKANIIAANKDAFNLISSNLSQINDKIVSSNMNIQSFSVNVFNGETSFNNGNGQGQNQDSREKKNLKGIEMENEKFNLNEDEDDLNKVNALV